MADLRPLRALVARRRFWKRVVRAADLVLGDRVAHLVGEDRMRARGTAIAGVLGGVAILIALFLSYAVVHWILHWATFGLALVILLIPLGLRYGLSLSLASHTLVASLWLYSSLIGVATGGHDTGMIFVSLFVPFVGILLGGLRAGFVWSGVMAASAGAIGLAVSLGYRAPFHTNPDAVAHWNFWAVAIGIVLMVGIGSSYEWMRWDAERRMEREQRRADRLHARQRMRDLRFQSELQALVAERTRELERASGALSRAERLASIGTLAAGVAHEINNPVGGILISAEYALGAEENGQRERIWREALEESRAQALRCARIVKSLLHFSSGSSATKAPQDLNAVVQGALRSMRGGLAEHDFARVETRLSGECVEVEGDRVALEQVVSNLVRNALEAAPDSNASVRVRTNWSEDCSILTVEDDGPGIERQDLARIFDPFFSTRERMGGTGLGLSIVHGIIREHGGSIDVESERARGTRFTIRLPRVPAAERHAS